MNPDDPPRLSLITASLVDRTTAGGCGWLMWLVLSIVLGLMGWMIWGP